jgi:hypothetical protein
MPATSFASAISYRSSSHALFGLKKSLSVSFRPDTPVESSDGVLLSVAVVVLELEVVVAVDVESASSDSSLPGVAVTVTVTVLGLAISLGSELPQATPLTTVKAAIGIMPRRRQAMLHTAIPGSPSRSTASSAWREPM